jgi:hypothetical protein
MGPTDPIMGASGLAWVHPENWTDTLEAFETLLFNNMILVLDRNFVHRLRMVIGKDGNPLNEVEL